MKTITLEEHFVTEGFLKAAFGDDRSSIMPSIRAMHEKLADLGDGRIRAMDEGAVDVQVLSLASMGLEKVRAAEQATVLRDVHDELAAAIAAHPQRFRGFVTPGLEDVPGAVREIERCMRIDGFVGVMVDGTVAGEFLDAPKFLPVLEAIEALGVPLYLHPAPPPQPVFDAYYAGLPFGRDRILSIAGWGWHSETAIHLMRLVLSGTLDRLPKLKVFVGHMGEGIPYFLARMDQAFARADKKLERNIAEIFREQVWITTSGMFTQPPFECAVEVVGLDRMMYSVDYPFSPTTAGKQFLASLEMTEPERAAFAGGTAAKLLRL